MRTECAALVAAAAVRVLRESTPHAALKSATPLLPVLWIVMGTACISTFTQWGGQYIIGPLCLALAINYLDCAPALVRRMLSNPVLRWFGRCSFSLYLWQQPFFIMALHGEIKPWLGCALGLVAGAVSFYALENPLRFRLNDAWSARKARIERGVTLAT